MLLEATRPTNTTRASLVRRFTSSQGGIMLEAQIRASPFRSPTHERLAGRAHTSPIIRGGPGIALAIFSSWRQAAGSRLSVAYKISGKARATEILSGEPEQEALAAWTKALGAGR